MEIEINTEILKNSHRGLGRLRYTDKWLETLRNKDTKTKTGRGEWNEREGDVFL